MLENEFFLENVFKVDTIVEVTFYMGFEHEKIAFGDFLSRRWAIAAFK